MSSLTRQNKEATFVGAVRIGTLGMKAHTLMRTVLLLVVLLGASHVAATASGTPTGIVNLTVLATDHFYGRIFPTNKYGSDVDLDFSTQRIKCSRGCNGGLAQYHAYAEAVRREKNNTILVSMGHNVHGSLFYVQDKGKAMLRLMGKMK